MRHDVVHLSPHELLHFIESSEFTASWEELGLDDEDDLSALQFTLMHGPKKAPLVAGTGGLRKLRFAPPRSGQGTRGAVRVCYVYFERFGVVLLVVAYGKREKEDLTPSEKAGIKQYLAQAERELERIHGLR